MIWTKDNIEDLTGKVIIVTGGNSGLGYESVKAFAEKGAEVVLTSRSLEKGNAAKAAMTGGRINGNVNVMKLDLMDKASIKKFTEDFLTVYNRLDVLLNNAGIMTTPYFLTKDGLEAQNGTNHFGHFALTANLLEVINRTPKSRVVNVSSNAHKWGRMDFDNLLFEGGKDYSPMKSYSRSKLANMLFTYELQRYFQDNNIDSIAVAAHPGASHTNLARHIEEKPVFKVLRPLFVLMTQDQAQGALPQIRASVDPDVKGGEYYGPSGFGELKGHPVKVRSNGQSKNQDHARKLWKISEELMDVKFSLS